MKGFIKIAHYKSHLKVHSDERPFQCQLCTKAFKRKNSLNKHESIHNLDHKKEEIKCNECLKTFKQKYNLIAHTNRYHSENSGILRPFKCQFCISRFKLKHNLNKHMKSLHANKLKFQCALCPLAIQTSADPFGACKHKRN